ncbi:MAG: hypothetical protein ISS41_09830 [Candidatus Aminicenantes bacterium]|nr:hypothetical protein [Candidatus Aminicenantes bacterium]
MNKAQKIICLIALALIFLSIIYPPYLLIMVHSKEGESVMKAGWGWLFGFKEEPTIISGLESENPLLISVTIYYYKVKFDILLCEILAIVILAGFFIVLAKKTKKRE